MSRRDPAVPLIERRRAPIGGPGFGIAIALAAMATGLLLGGLLFIPFDSAPVDGYSTLFREGFGTGRGLGDTLVKAGPLIFIGLGTIVTWRAGFFFLGFQGCLLMGATGSAVVALAASDGRPLDWAPTAAMIPLTLIAAATAAGIWSGIVGYLKACHDGNEVLLSLMMNFVAAFLLNYLVSGPMRAEGALPQTERFDESATLPLLLARRTTSTSASSSRSVLGVSCRLFRLTASVRPEATGPAPGVRAAAGMCSWRREPSRLVLGGLSRASRGGRKCSASNTAYSTASTGQRDSRGSWPRFSEGCNRSERRCRPSCWVACRSERRSCSAGRAFPHQWLR